MSGSNPFLNGPNYQTIVGFLRQKYTQQLRVASIPEKLDQRIQKTVQHYMTEIARAKGTTQPVVALNRDVVKETTASVDAYLKKADTIPQMTTVGAPIKPDEYAQLFQDANQRYEAMMADRTPPSMPVPPLPDFRPTDRSSAKLEDPVALMQREQKAREDQARATGAATNRLSSVFGSPGPSTTANTIDEPRLEIREESLSLIPSQAESPPPLLAPRPQEYIIKQEDVVKYREMEYNIFITSADRDWARNTSENRYNFSVLFNTGSKKIGYGYNTAIQERFRNIQRIEFVKAIVPIESYTAIIRKTDVSTFDTGRVVNVFSLPFAAVRIAELNNNGFSTNPMEDNTFAIVQYDTTWSSDLVSPQAYSTSANVNLPATRSGYAGLIPKFLKCQKVYTPTPLATLQKLSIRLERHDQSLLSDSSDVLQINQIAFGNALGGVGPTGSAATNYGNATNDYIFIQTSTYFLFSAVGEGDTLSIQGVNLTPQGSTLATTVTDFETFINAEQYVVAVGVANGTTSVLNANNAGYANCIILRNRFVNPTTGTIARSYFGGIQTQDDALATQLGTSTLTGAALLNVSRQSHIVLRIITRDMDSGSNIRPDNV